MRLLVKLRCTTLLPWEDIEWKEGCVVQPAAWNDWHSLSCAVLRDKNTCIVFIFVHCWKHSSFNRKCGQVSLKKTTTLKNSCAPSLENSFSLVMVFIGEGIRIKYWSRIQISQIETLLCEALPNLCQSMDLSGTLRLIMGFSKCDAGGLLNKL